MLVLTRKTQEKIQIGDSITITILRVKGQAVRIGIEAPEGVRILRGELAARAIGEAGDEQPAISEEGVAELTGTVSKRGVSQKSQSRRPSAVATSLLQFRISPEATFGLTTS